MRTGAAILLVLWGALALAAPAPLPRKNPSACQCPSFMEGHWKLCWHGRDYHYHFNRDGSFTHVWRNDGTDYSGDWKLVGDRLLIREGPNAFCKYELAYENGKWVASSGNVILSR